MKRPGEIISRDTAIVLVCGLVIGILAWKSPEMIGWGILVFFLLCVS